MKKEDLDLILENHKKWLSARGGQRANLSSANLSSANLSRADLSWANLSGANLSAADLRGANLRADLRGANLSSANLSGANLSAADLRGANLSSANLSSANLSRADLSGANLSSANLSWANLRWANLEKIISNEYTAFLDLSCPETGEFIGWKKCRDGVIVKLLITKDAKRSSATSRKCRCSKAKVLDVMGGKVGVSFNDENFKYIKGKTVLVKNFDEDRWNECSSGIHFFITKKEAEN